MFVMYKILWGRDLLQGYGCFNSYFGMIVVWELEGTVQNYCGIAVCECVVS